MNTILLPEFELESGQLLRDAPVAYHSWGALNEKGDNAVIVCHALTGDSDVSAWWGGLLGPGKALDTDRYFIVAANVLGSPYGSVSPLSVHPGNGLRYGGAFPQVTIRDTVRAHKLLLDELGVQRLELAIGGSMGGMQVLEWAFMDEFVKRIVPIAVGGRHSAWCIAWSEAQRQAIYADEKWKDGMYEPGDQPSAGLAAARMMAMVSYRSMEIYQQRFGRDQMPSVNDTEGSYAVQSYLWYQGQKLVERFDANCYVRLTEQMDTHDVSRGRGEYLEVLRSIRQPALVIGIDSDVLYPLAEQKELASNIPGATLSILNSPHGHDAFLIEIETLNTIIIDWKDVERPVSQKCLTPCHS